MHASSNSVNAGVAWADIDGCDGTLQTRHMTRHSPTRIALTMLLSVALVADWTWAVAEGCTCDTRVSSQKCCAKDNIQQDDETGTCCCHQRTARHSCCHTGSSCCQGSACKLSQHNASECRCQRHNQQQIPPAPQPDTVSSNVLKHLLSQNAGSQDVADSFARINGSLPSAVASDLRANERSVQVLLCCWLT